MAQENNLPNVGAELPDYSGYGILSEEDKRYFREITENSFERKQARIAQIRNSGKSALEQIKELTYDPYAKRDIVAYILQNGPFIIHILKPSTLVDEQGNDLMDFVESDADQAFVAIIALLKELEKPQYAEVVKANASYLRAVKRATEVWGDILEMRQEAGMLWCGDDPGTVFLDEDGIEGCVYSYNLARNFILSCARWELEKVASQDNLVKTHMQVVVKKYVREQMGLLQSYFRTYMRNVNALIPLVDWNN